MNEHPLWKFVEDSQDRFRALSDRVWATPETCYAETASVAAHVEELTHQGFRVQENLAGIATAVIWQYDSGAKGVKVFEGILKAMVGVVVLSFFGVVVTLMTGENSLPVGEIHGA